MESRNRLLKRSLVAGAVAAAAGLAACGEPETELSRTTTEEIGSDSAAGDRGRFDATADDRSITAEVEAALAADERLSRYDIDVHTEDGVVTLTGSVPEPQLKQTAEQVARRAADAAAVNNAIDTQGGAMGQNAESSTGEMSERVENAAQNMGDSVSDAWITTKVKTQLVADAETEATDIDVDTENGVVTLTGTVEQPADRERVIEIAESIEGVRQVDDSRLQVASN